MGELVKQFLAGAGSALALFPDPRPTITRPQFMRVSRAERMGSDWRRVGMHLDAAMSKVREEVPHGAAK